MDPTCPLCKGKHDIGDIFDGITERCHSCGRELVAVAYTDDTMMMVDANPPPPDTLTGKQRQRARWNKQGRR